MDWATVDAPAPQVALAQVFVGIVPSRGVSPTAADQASETVDLPWRETFRGLTGLLWFVSEVSDASMAAVFADRPADDMAAVILERFEQNAGLKAFVRRVMAYDLAHPLQALARMQRTARRMYGCLAGRRVPGAARLAVLNFAYTALVFVWLLDRTPDDRRTRRLTARVMRLIGL